VFNPLKAELNPICHLLALLGGATIVVVSRLMVNRVVKCLLNTFLREIGKGRPGRILKQLLDDLKGKIEH
jgi:hypothetical protein